MNNHSDSCCSDSKSPLVQCLFWPFLFYIDKTEWGCYLPDHKYQREQSLRMIRMEVWRSVNKTNQLLCLVCYLSFTNVLKPSVNISKSKNAMSQKMPWQVSVPCKTESSLRHPKAGFFLAALIEQRCLSNTFIQIKAYLWTEINNAVTAINNSANPNWIPPLEVVPPHQYSGTMIKSIWAAFPGVAPELSGLLQEAGLKSLRQLTTFMRSKIHFI